MNLKNIINEIINSLDGLISKIEKTQQSVNLNIGQQKLSNMYNKNEKKKRRVLGTCGTITECLLLSLREEKE